MYNIPGLAGEPSIENIGMQTRGSITFALIGWTMLQAPMIEPRGHQPAAALGLVAEFGGLVPTPTTAMMNWPWPERVRIWY
jgi:hypothetical protein